MQHSGELLPTPVLCYMGTNIHLLGRPTVPRNISAIMAEIWGQMKPQHIASDAVMMILEAKAKLLQCVCTVWALHEPAGKLTQDHLPTVC